MRIPARVSFVTLACRDVAAMKRFYDQFGWPPSQHNDETFAAYPACSLNARGAKLTDVFAVWNVVTHGYKLRIRSYFVLSLSPILSQGEG